MKASIRERLETVSARYEEIGLLLSQPEIFSDQNRFRELSVEYAQLEPLVKAWQSWRDAHTALEEAESMLQETDPDLDFPARYRRCLTGCFAESVRCWISLRSTQPTNI